MADGPNSPGPSSRPYGMPLSPHLSVYRWTITMAASITHRATGMALAGGTLVLAWWLTAAAAGPESYAVFANAAAHPLGQIALFGFVWALSFHLLNGIRHLFWDIGLGFKVPTAHITAALVYGGSIVLTALVFLLSHMVRGGLAS